MTMPYDEFTSCIGIPSAVCRKRCASAVVAIPILKEKEVRAAVASQLCPHLIAIASKPCAVKDFLLPELARYMIFHDVIGHSADVAVDGDVIGVVKIGEMQVVIANLILVSATQYCSIILTRCGYHLDSSASNMNGMTL